MSTIYTAQFPLIGSHLVCDSYHDSPSTAVAASDTNFEAKKAPTSLKAVRYEEACHRLAVEAVKRGCTDNVTVMIVDIASKELDKPDSPAPSEPDKQNSLAHSELKDS